MHMQTTRRCLCICRLHVCLVEIHACVDVVLDRKRRRRWQRRRRWRRRSLADVLCVECFTRQIAGEVQGRATCCGYLFYRCMSCVHICLIDACDRSESCICIRWIATSATYLSYRCMCRRVQVHTCMEDEVVGEQKEKEQVRSFCVRSTQRIHACMQICTHTYMHAR
jgi:hypothetical protein